MAAPLPFGRTGWTSASTACVVSCWALHGASCGVVLTSSQVLPLALHQVGVRANSCSLFHCDHVESLLPTPGCLSLGLCQNFILDFDTSSYFRARSNKCLICICTAPLGWNAWSINTAFALPVDAGHHTQCVFLPLLLHRSLCLSSLSCTAKLPLFTYILKVTLQRNCFLKIMRNEPSQKLENETLFLLWCPREISSAVNWKGCSCCLCDHSALTPRSDCRWISDMLSRGLKVLLHVCKTGWGGQETFFPCLPWFLPTQKMWAHP